MHIKHLDVWEQNDSEAIFAVIKATNGSSRLSAYMLRDAILRFYSNNHLFPAGLCADAECTQTWALKHGNALKRLVALLIDIVPFVQCM